MKLNFFEKIIGSGFYTGFISFAPGTFGSIAALIIYFIPGFENPLILIPVIIIFTFYGFFIGNKFEIEYKKKDPQQFTLDEFVGMWISLLFLPKILLVSLLTFIVWRILDILKPFPIRKLEKLNGGIGIMIDDILAGIYSSIIVHIILFIFKIR